MKSKVIMGIMLILLFIGMLTLALDTQLVKSDSRTWTVDDDGPADFHTIQEAINAANPGDTIYVYNGTHYENVVVNKSISLIGESRETTIIDGSNVGNVVEVTEDNVNISGFTIRRGEYYSGIELSSVKNCNICGNNLTDNGDGVYLDNSSDNCIYTNNIANNGWGTCLMSGIRLYDSSNNNWIYGNNLTNNLIGIGLFSSFNTVFRNRIANNYDGIYFDGVSNNDIYENNIINNNQGVRFDNSPNNKFYHDNFINNTRHVISDMSTNIWDDGYPSGGNYWSNYTGVDANMDGIGDSSHEIDSKNTDRYPLMGIFSDFPTTLGEETYHVTTVCNSTLTTYEYDALNRLIRFNVTGPDYTLGFCRVCIPHDLMEPPYTVAIDGCSPQYVNYTLYDNDTHRWIYFNYQHSTHEVIITQAPVGGIYIPINKLELLAPYIGLTTLLAIAVMTLCYVKKRKRNTEINS